MDKGDCVYDPEAMQTKLVSIKERLQHVLYTLKQFLIVLDSWPSNCKDLLQTHNYHLLDTLPDIMVSSKGDEAHAKVYQKIVENIKVVENCLLEVDNEFGKNSLQIARNETRKIFITSKESALFTSKHEEVLEKASAGLKCVLENLKVIQDGLNSGGMNPLSQCLNFTELNDIHNAADVAMPSADEGTSLAIIEKEIKLFLQGLLLGVQKVLQKYRKVDGTNPGKS